jgi:hypothetical protein
MAQLRLIAARVVAVTVVTIGSLGACRTSEAGPSSGLTAPAGWRLLPELAAAASDAAKQASVTVDGVEAWGEPSQGCYGAWLGLHADVSAASKLADAMLANISVDLPGVTISDVIKPVATADAGVLSLAFVRPPYQGRLRSQIAGTGALGVLVCFWNPREPIACEAACAQLIGSMK